MRIGDGGRLLVTSLALFLLLCPSPGEGCGPGRGSGRRRKTRKLTPLVFKQHVPNVSENTLGASGLTDGRIRRGDAKFKDLVRNNNPDILFKDEEGTGADRIMSQRCKDKLNTLAISVLNQWPGIKLRVTEAWDEDGMHAENSLHYEGRAVDITTSDRDRSKYGMLARLAVEAGFDWVYYETRGHVHCSVKSDSSVAINFGGCFPPLSRVISSSGRTLSMSEVKVGDQILTAEKDGSLVFSDVVAFLDNNPGQMVNYYTLITETGHSITLTAKHLIYTLPGLANTTDDRVSTSRVSFNNRLPRLAFAQDAEIGHYVLFAKEAPVEGYRQSQIYNLPHRPTQMELNGSSSSYCYFKNDNAHSSGMPWKLTPERISSIQVYTIKGMYAPLTATGTIVVDGVVASCYAFFKDEHLAHTVLAPLRAYYITKTLFSHWLRRLQSCFDWLDCILGSSHSLAQNQTLLSSEVAGTHWYARLLYSLAVNILGLDLYIAL